MPIEKDEIDFLCKNTRLGKQIGSKEMKKQMDRKGAVKLTGEQALIFCRIRKLDDDFQRTERQRRLLNSMMQAMKKNPLRVFGLLNGEALSTIQTDMSQARMANLAITSPLFLGYDMEEFTVPVKGTWSYATKRGTSVITMNTSQNAEKLYKFIYEK